MKLLIIRHGESEADLLDVHEGRANYALSKKGHKQAELMSAWVASHYGDSITKIYSSPLTRAMETASYLSRALNLEICADDNLMEYNNGLIAGLDRDTAAEKYPSIPDLPIHAAVYEQESRLEFRFRADYMLSKIMTENPDDSTVAIISHGGLINQLFHSFLKLPVDSDLFISTGDTGIHCCKILKNAHRIIYLNNFSHMLELL